MKLINIFKADVPTFSGYKLQDKLRRHGMAISIETDKGQTRSGTDGNGKKWFTLMKYPYGYIRGTKGVDKDHLDCYIGPNENAEFVYVIHQVNPSTKKYDEDKCMIGFDSREEAKQAFLDHYDSPDFYGSMTVLTVDDFKEKAFNSKKGKMVKAEIRRPDGSSVFKHFQR